MPDIITETLIALDRAATVEYYLKPLGFVPMMGTCQYKTMCEIEADLARDKERALRAMAWRRAQRQAL